MIRLAQLYTGGVGSEIVRRCAGHPELELVAVMVHADDKAGTRLGRARRRRSRTASSRRSSSTTCSRRDPDAAIHSGLIVRPRADHHAAARWRERVHRHRRLLPAGHTRLRRHRHRRRATATRRSPRAATSPGLISDVWPLFVTGYTGRIRQIRARPAQRRVDVPVGACRSSRSASARRSAPRPEYAEMFDADFTSRDPPVGEHGRRRPRVECTDCVLAEKRTVVAEDDIMLPASGCSWSRRVRWPASSGRGRRRRATTSSCGSPTSRPPHCASGRAGARRHEDPPWRVEIDGEPPIVTTFGWPRGRASRRVDVAAQRVARR